MKLVVFTIGFVLQACIVDHSNAYTHHHRQVHVAPPSKQGGTGTGINVIPGPGDGTGSNLGSGVDVIISYPGGGSTGGGNSGIPPPMMGSVVKGLECGSTVQMYAGGVAQVFSTNFGVANYNNYETCSWKFQANHCTLSAHCPCVEIPKSWECLGDYLRVSTDKITTSQRFCGGNKPGQPIYSESDSLNIKFRSDGRITAAGFTCFLRCEGPGMKIPLTSPTCPTSLVFKG